MLRNRDLFLQATLSILVSLACAGTVYALVGIQAALATLVAALCISALHAAFSYRRDQKIVQLAEQVDRALAGDRSVSFSDMSEGELAILSSEIDKTLTSLSIANEDLSKEKSALADSLADISHQLRTPLTSLGLELDLVRKQVGEEQSVRIMSAEKKLEQLQWLVSSLLKLARLDAGTVELTRQTVDVQSLIDSAFEPLAVSFDLANVSFKTFIEPDTSFEGDPSWTREAITNVLKNCLEHTPSQGRVGVEAYEDTLACRIRIQDTGAGFSEEDIPHVFERFWRSSTSTQEDSVNPAGVGIGLSLTRALITAQGGQITAANAHANDGSIAGAQFDITFFKVVV